MNFLKTFGAAFLIAALASGSALAADKGLVLVAGATGQTGRPLIKILKAEGYTVRAMVRGDTTAAELGADEVVKADVTQYDTLPPAVTGVDYVMSAIGTASGGVPEEVDYKGTAALVDASKAAGVKQFVLVSSVVSGNTDPERSLNKTRGMVFMWKGKADEHVRNSGLPYTIMRPGGLDNCDHGKVGIALGSLGEEIEGGRICRADMALVMVESLGNPDAIGKSITVMGDTTGEPVDAWRGKLAQVKKD